MKTQLTQLILLALVLLLANCRQKEDKQTSEGTFAGYYQQFDEDIAQKPIIENENYIISKNK